MRPAPVPVPRSCGSSAILGYEPVDRLNKPEDFILAMVEFIDDTTERVHYLRQPFQREPDFDVTSVNYDFGKLLERAEAPS